MRSVIQVLHDRYFQADIAIKATEDWSERTKANKPIFKRLVTLQSKFELALRKHFRSLSENHESLVNWTAYALANIQDTNTPLHAAEVTVTNNGSSYVSAIDSAVFANEKQLLQALMIEYITQGMGIGIDSANDLYVDSGLSVTSEAVQKEALENSSQLVTQITDTTRAQIQQSIATSLKLGETVQDAQVRLSSIIDNPNRAEMIARTETRSSYVAGSKQVALATGATTQEWDPSTDPCPLCQENADAGVISINDDFPNGDDPHPNCQCGDIIYGYGNDDSGDDSTD